MREHESQNPLAVDPLPLNAGGLEVRSLTVRYPGSGKAGRAVEAVSDVSFRVKPNETFGLVGESGAGKSSLIRCVAGYLTPSRGEVLCNGVDLRTLSSRRPGAWKTLRVERRRRQLVPQNTAATLNPRLPVGVSIAEALEGGDSAGRPSWMPFFRLTRHRRACAQLLERVGMHADDLDKRPAEFSGGQQQRICIARALAAEPSLLLLDEPTASLDASIAANIIRLLQRLREQTSITLVVVSHDLAVVADLCDTVGVLRNGRLIECNERRELFGNPREEYTKTLLDAVPRIVRKPQGSVWSAWDA